MTARKCSETAMARDDHYVAHQTFGHVCTGQHHEDRHRCACGATWRRGEWASDIAASTEAGE